MSRKVSSLVVALAFLLTGIVAFAGPAGKTPIGAPSLSVSPATATGTVGSLLTFVVTVTRPGPTPIRSLGQTPIGAPSVELRCEFMPGSVHYPKTLKAGDSYVIEFGPGDGRSKVTDYWKKEKIYINNDGKLDCVSDPKGQAGFRYAGIYEGTDSIKVSATVDGRHLEARATVRWRKRQ